MSIAGRVASGHFGFPKDGSVFCYSERIHAEIHKLFRWLKEENFLRGRDKDTFARAGAHFLAELNAIHPFRDGNGRSQLTFAALLATRAGYPLDLTRLAPAEFLGAMVASFRGNESPLVRQLLGLLRT
jgi:cell filamentation protein